MTTVPDPHCLIQSAKLKKKLGDCSDMWIHRRLHDDSGFPKPIYIGRRRYWKESEITAWLEEQPKKLDAQPDNFQGMTAEQLRAEAQALCDHADALEAQPQNKTANMASKSKAVPSHATARFRAPRD